MTLVDIKERQLTSREPAANEVDLPRSNAQSSAKTIVACKGQHLDVDGILARSLPNTAAFPPKDLKRIVFR